MAGAASLQLTRHGAFGHLFFSDIVRSAEYRRAEEEAIRDGAQSLAADTYDQSRANVASIVALHARLPRVEGLAALAAFEEALMTLRFGTDPKESGSAAVLLKVLPLDRAIAYRTAALAADAGAHGDIEKARRTLETAKREQSGDARRRGFVREIDILAGELALAARDYKEALAAFTKANVARPDARASFGLARANWGAGDRARALAALDKVRVESAKHVGARILRATIAEHREGEESVGMEQLAPVLDGALRAFAAPFELAEAYATRGWLAVHRGAFLDARAALDEALKLNPRSLRALRGQGELLMREGRYTEALTRFETALQAAPTADATADVARAMLKLERSEEAKKRLVEAVEKFPKHPTLLALLGQVERNLGNLPAAEERCRAAVAAVDPSRRDGVLPFVTLSSYLSARGQAKEGEAVLEEARSKLPDSAALQKAFGEVTEVQGDLERSLKHYRAALTREPTDVATRFRTAVALRKLRRADEASQELTKIEAADKDFPGLSVEKGLLFEMGGQVERAIEAFKTALERAPNDLDLQLRVGSAYVTIGRHQEALAMLAKVLEQRPQSAEVNYAVGRAHMLRGREGEVETLLYLKQAVALDPNRAEYHLYLGWAANEATPPQLSIAREEVDKALAIDQGLCDGYWQRGVLHRKGGSVNDALTDMKRALQLCPARYEIHGSLAELYEDRNEIPAALASWAIAMRVGNAKPFAHYRYGRLLAEHGKAGEAGQHFEAAEKGIENVKPKPAWYIQLEFYMGEKSARAGNRQQAAAHFQKYLDNAPPKAPDRKAAQKYVDQETK
jgi:tetratricopeptide (TPR) repeat protein